ncbi:unnamed protein product [Orchesella dallaii]|uniref:Uncharacterized protein n=1 Tax=Orchesella dallaii TaxID=48710 RepID=A0ABP1RGZ5_9HEXA
MGAAPPNRINAEILGEFSSIPMEELPEEIFERFQNQDEEPPLDLLNVLEGELNPNNVQLTPDCNTEVPGSARTRPSTPNVMPPPLPTKSPKQTQVSKDSVVSLQQVNQTNLNKLKRKMKDSEDFDEKYYKIQKPWLEPFFWEKDCIDLIVFRSEPPTIKIQ